MNDAEPPSLSTASPFWRWPWFTLLIAVVSVVIHALGWSKQLEFDRGLVAGEPWRLFTAHVTHFEGDHLGWDVALWLAFGIWAERLGRARFVTCVAGAAAAISIAVLFFQPQFLVYRGLSGLDSTAFAFVVGHLAVLGRRTGDRRLALVSGLALTGFLAKCGYEAAFDAAVFVSSSGFVPVPLAHLVGALCGIVGAWPKRASAIRPVTATAPAKSGTGAVNA